MKQSNQIKELFQLLPQKELQNLINKWHMDKNVRTLSTRKMLFVCISSQIFQLATYREIGRIFSVAKSTLADAITNRSHGFFEDLCAVVVEKIVKHHKGRRWVQ